METAPLAEAATFLGTALAAGTVAPSATFICDNCKGSYKTKGGLSNHRNKCLGKDTTRKSTDRSSIPLTVRTQVWREAFRGSMDGACYCCKEAIKFEQWHCGHLKSYVNGGTTDPTNLRPLCGKCNLSMGSDNIYDYMVKRNLDIPDELTKLYPDKTADRLMAKFNEQYDKLVTVLRGMDAEIQPVFMTFVRCELPDLKLDTELYTDILVLDRIKAADKSAFEAYQARLKENSAVRNAFVRFIEHLAAGLSDGQLTEESAETQNMQLIRLFSNLQNNKEKAEFFVALVDDQVQIKADGPHNVTTLVQSLHFINRRPVPARTFKKYTVGPFQNSAYRFLYKMIMTLK